MVGNFIKYNILRIFPENLEKTINFYKTLCEMNYNIQQMDNKNPPYKSTDNQLHVFSYPAKQTGVAPTGVCFVLDTDHKVHYKNAGYWKIGLALRDVNAAVQHFNGHGFIVNEGSQFYDVGFLTSLDDPNGHNIELLQEDFEVNFVPPTNSDGYLSQPVSSPPSVGQITIRCTNAERTKAFYQQVLGMKLLCVEQPNNSFPFTLYFFAYTDDVPPSPHNLSDVVNREWLYKKPYCQIEVQHRHNLPHDYKLVTSDENDLNINIGHVGFFVAVSPLIMSQVKSSVDVQVRLNAHGEEVCFLRDPDGYVVQVELNGEE